MQVVTDEARELLTADPLEVDFGCELLALDLTLVRDISEDLAGGSIARNMDARIHGSCRLDISTELSWGSQLVQPYLVLSSGDVSVRFNCGVYMLTTPEKPVGESPATFRAQGLDRLYLLDREVGEAYSETAGTTYRDALLAVFAAAGLTGVLIDGAAGDFTLPVDREWPLVASSTDPDQTSTPVTWLRIVNDLQTAWNGRAVWADENGLYRCQAYLDPQTRATEFTFDADDELVSIVGEDRTVIADMWKTPNRWVFLWSNRPGGMSDTEGDGKYTVDNIDDGPTSQDQRQMIWPQVIAYEAADQSVLEDLGNRRVAADRRLATTIQATTGPFPAAGHFDVFKLTDAEIDASKVQATAWEFDLAGGDVRWTWEVVA